MILATARRRSLGVGDDLELDVATISRGHHLQQAADRVRDAAVATDDSAHVVLIDADKLNAWIAKGARPSDTVGKLMRQVGIGADAPAAAAKPAARAKPAAKTTRTRKAPAKAAATAEE